MVASKKTWLRVALVAAVGVALLVAYRLGAFAGVADPATLARWLVERGAWGYLAFVVAYAALQPFGVPGTVFIVAAPLIWPWHVAFALSMVGTMAASVIGFSLARFVARDWISRRVPERFKRYEAALERNGLRTVFLLRLVFWMPQMLHTFLGVSKVSFWKHFWGSVLGYLPTLFVVSFFGAEIIDLHGQFQPRAWPIMGGLLAGSLLMLAGTWLYERRMRAAAAAQL